MVLRRADATETEAVRAVYLSATAEKLYMRAGDPDVGTTRWITGFLGCGYLHELWVADLAGQVVGFATVAIDSLGHLYVMPEFQNRGIGTALLRNAQRIRPEGLTLFTFRRDAAACRFYERHGFVVEEFLNDAGEADVSYYWPA